MKLTYIIAGIVILSLFAVIVMAFAFDSDGGYNIRVKGTCTDDFGNHTDKCYNSWPPGSHSYLTEWYNATGANYSTYCESVTVDCLDYNLTCSAGACN